MVVPKPLVLPVLAGVQVVDFLLVVEVLVVLGLVLLRLGVDSVPVVGFCRVVVVLVVLVPLLPLVGPK
jgi:hypothetical protein